MPLNPPNLDTRNYDDLVAEARRRIPLYTPEWTDFNDSDPGMTLVQLAAWLTELQLYEMNRLPELNYVKLLQLFDIKPQSPEPATAHLTFTARAGGLARPIEKDTRITAGGPDGVPLVFETEEPLDPIPIPLESVQVFDGGAFLDVTANNDPGGEPFAPFGPSPRQGAALYLGFAFNPDNPPARPFPAELRLRVFLPPAVGEPDLENCENEINPPPAPAELAWEYRREDDPDRWRPLNVYLDETGSFTREGYVVLEGPRKDVATLEARGDKKRFWLRCRLTEPLPAGIVPRFEFIRPNVAPARNLSTVREEILGTSDGTPNQVFKLDRAPVQAESLELIVEEPEDGERLWTPVDDLICSGSEARHYRLDATTAEITFGDGTYGRIPPGEAGIVARRYRYGGGHAGNLPAGAVNTPGLALQGIESVTNERPSVGGRDEQDINELKRRAPKRLRARNRAVTEQDFAELAAEVGGVARARAIALMHPDFPDVRVPGAVTVVVVPENDERRPKPSPDLLREVCRKLNRVRLLTTEVHVRGPRYRKVSVEATVSAGPQVSLGALERKILENLDMTFSLWDFGRDFFPSSVYGEIFDIEGVDGISHLEVYVDDKLIHSDDKPTKQFVLKTDELLYGADHRITVVRARDL